MKRNPNCTLCPLHKTAEYVCLLGQGPEPAKAMIVGEAPGRREDDSGKPFVGQSGKLLDKMLDKIGLKRKDLFITNAVSCRPPDNRTPKRREIDACSKWLKYQIAMVKPKFILAMGNVAMISLTGDGGIKKKRGKPFEKDGITILPTYHPSYALRDETQQAVIEQDLQAFKDIIDFGGIPEERELNYSIVDTRAKFKAMLDKLHGTVSYDLETSGLYPWDDGAKIVSVNIGIRDEQFSIPINHYLMKQDIAWDELVDALDECNVINHNMKFDVLWTWVHTGHRLTIGFDTMLAHYLLDENARHDLEHLAALYFGAPNYDVPLAVKQGREGTLEQHCKYASTDVFYTRKAYFKLMNDLKKDLLVKRLYDKLMLPVANLFCEIEYNGIYINEDGMDEAEEYLLGEMNAAQKEWDKWGKGVNMASPQQVAELFFKKLKIKPLDKTAGGAASTSESVMKRIDHPAALALLRNRGAKQQHSFFIKGWRPFIVKSRIHPSFKLHGTVTGRPSCEHPNFQQVPRDKRIRSLIGAPPGWTFLEADLSQIEVRVTAELAQEYGFLEAFNTGQDVHLRTALRMFSVSGEYDIVQETAVKYLDQNGGQDPETIVEIFSEVGHAEKAGQFIMDLNSAGKEMPALRKAISTLLNKNEVLLKGLSKTRDQKRSDNQKKTARVDTSQTKLRPSSSELERWKKELGYPKISENLLRAMWQYVETNRNAPQRQRPQKKQEIKLDHAMFIVSQIGPQACEEINEDWKEKRKLAKALVFGLIYGMWWRKLVIYARDNYGIKLTEQQAQDFRAAFFEFYSSLEGWHNHQRRVARMNGFVRSLTGRTRRLPEATSNHDTPQRAEALRQAINSPVQSFASDLNLMVLLQLRKEYPRSIVRPVMTVHDMVGAEVRNDKVPEVVKRIEEIMRGPDLLKEFDIELGVPICGETKLGPWGTGVSLDKWLLSHVSK